MAYSRDALLENSKRQERDKTRHEHIGRQYIYWPFFDKKYNSSIGIGIGTFKKTIFAFLLLLLVIKILNIGLYLGNIWYCFDIVHWHTLIPSYK